MSDKNNLQVEVHVDVSQPESQIDNLKGSVTDFLREILPEFDTAGSKLLGFVKNIYTAKNSIANVSDEATNFFKKYENNGKDLTKSVSNSLAQTGGFDSFVNSSKLADKSLIAFLKNADYGTKNLANYQKYLNETGKKTSVFSQFTTTAINGLKSFGTSLASAGISSLIDMGISAAIEGLDYLIHYEEIQEKAFEDAKKGTAETANSITALKSEISDTSSKAASLSSEFASLVQGVNPFTNENINLSTESYQQFLDVNNQLAELFPSLCHSYDENGNAILGLSGDVDSVTASIQRLVTQQNNLAKSDMRKHLEEYVNGTDDSEGVFTALEGYKKDVAEAENETNSLEFLYNGLINKKGKQYFGMNSITWMNYLNDAKNKFGEDAYDALYNATVYNIGEGAGGSRTYSIDFSKIKLDEKKKKSITDSYKALKQDLDLNTSLKKSELDAKNREMSSMMMTWLEDTGFYKNEKNQDPFTKRTIEQMVGSIKWSDLNLDNLDDSKKFIQDSVLTPLSHIKNDPKTKLEVENAISDLFTTDFSKMSFEDADEKVASFLKIIRNGINKHMPEEQKKSLDDMYEMYGFETYRDTKDKLQKRLEQIAPKGTKDYQRIREYTDKLNRKQIEEFLDVTYDSTIPEDAIHKYEEHIKSNKKNKRQPFQKIWDTLDTTGNSDADKKATEEKEKLLQLAEKGKLTVNEFKKSSIAGTILDGTKLSEEEATLEINNLVENVKQLETMRTGIRAITSVYSEKKNSEQNVVSPSTLNSLENTIDVDSWKDKDKKVWENYKSVAGDDSRSLTDLKKAQDELASSYVNSNNFLSNLKETNKDYYEGLLKEMGVINAHEIVTERLENEQKNLSIVKKELGIKASDFKNATVSEIAALYDVKSASKKASTAMYNLLSSKIKSGQVTIKTAADCQNLINMANAAGIATHKIKNLQNAEMKFSRAERLEKEADGLQATINAAPDGKEIEYVKQTGQIEKFSSKTSAATRIADYRRLSKKNKDEAEKDVAKWYNKNYKKIKLSDVNPKDDGKGDENKYKNTKQQFDWIERRVNRLTSSINLLNAKKENLFSVKKKNSNLNKQIKETTKLINTYSSAIKKYDKKADSVKIFKDKKKDKNIKKLIRNGKIQIEDYDEGTAKKIQAYQNWYDKSKSAEQSLAEAKKQKREKEIEKFTGLQEEQDKEAALANVKQQTAKLSNKNKAINDEANATKKSYNYQIKIAEAQGDKLLISKLKEEKKQKELEFQQQRVDNIKALYDARRNILDTGSVNNNSSRKTYGGQYYKNQVELAETRGLVVDASWYQQQNRIEQSKIAESEQERAQLISKLSAFEESTQEWYNLQADIAECDKDIVESRKAINENSSSIRSLKDSIDNKIDENLKSYASELDFVSGLKYENELDSDTGSFTDTGNLHILSEDLKITVGREAAKNFSQSLKMIEQLYSGNASHEQWELAGFSGYFNDDGSINKKAVEEKIKNLRNSVQSFINMQIEGEKRLIELGKQKYEAQKNYLNDIINAKKNALSIEKDLYDYERSIAEKTQAVANIQKQIHSLQGDDSEEGRARLAKLQVSLDTAQKDLQDTEYSRYISDQQSMLDNLMTEYEDLITNLMNDTDKILLDMYDYIKNNEGGLGDLFIQSAEKYGYVTSQDLIDIVNAFKGINDNKIEEVIYDKIKAEQISQSANDDDRAAKEARAEKEARAAAEAATKKAEAAKRNNVDIISRATDKALRGELTDRVNPYQKTKNKISSNLKGIFQAASFASGGIVDYKPSGEDGLVWARNGEGFVQPEDVPPIKELIRTAPKLNEFTNPLLHLSKTPDITPNRPMNTTSIENVQFTFDLPNVQDSRTLLSEIQSNSKIQRAILEVGLGQEHGNGKLAVRRIR